MAHAAVKSSTLDVTFESSNFFRMVSTSPFALSSRAAEAAAKIWGAEVELEESNWLLNSAAEVLVGMSVKAFSITDRVVASTSALLTEVCQYQFRLSVEIEATYKRH